MRQFVGTMRVNGDVMWQMAEFNQTQRRRGEYELSQRLSEIDGHHNKIFQLEQNRNLYTKKYDVLEEQFTLLFDSIETISNAKNLEDKFANEIAWYKDQVDQQTSEMQVLGDYVKATTTDRDMYRQNTHTLIDAKQKLEKEKQMLQDVFKKRAFELDREVKQKTDEA